MYTQYNATSCARTNEPPTASNVNVKPVNPTAGHNLLCNYTFSDLEGDFDINSVIYWYRNGAYQNLSEHQILPSNYTLPGEQWSCGVNPSDGNNIGSNVNATANVTVQNTVANATFTLGNQSVWNTTDYYAGPTTIPTDTQITTYLMNCTADAQGNCLVPLTFTSTRTGSLRLSNITIYYNFTNRSFAPIINQQEDITVNETQLVQFSINVSDPNNNTFNVTINDPGRFSQTGNYSYQWQTGYDDNGQYPVIITATNNLSLQSTMSFTVTVNNVNRPFNVTYNNTAAQENQNVTANITVADPDNTNNNTADDNNFTFTYSSTFDMNGIAHLSYNEYFNYSVNVFINQSEYNASIDFTLFVLNVNRPPVLNLNNITANEGELIIIPNGTDPDNTNNVSNDDNSLSYTYSAPFNASGMWQTNYLSGGNYSINVTLSDGEYQVSQTISISVLNVNQPPVIQFIPNVNVTAPANFTVIVNASDPDPGEILSYYVNDTHFSQNNNSFQWSATTNDVGFYVARFTVSDGLFNTSQNVNITIIGPSNISLINFTILYNQSSSKIIEFVISNNGFAPLSGVNWSIDYGDQSSAKSTTPISLFFEKDMFTEIQHTYGIGGNVTITVNASIPNITRTQSISMTVNLPIIYSIPQITGDENMSLWINASGIDPESQPLTWSINDTRFTAYGSNFTWTPSFNDEGTYYVKVSATDGTYQQNQTVQVNVRSGENLTLNSFSALGNDSQRWVFAAELQNLGFGFIPSINFTIAYGDGEQTSSTTPASITGNNRLFINVQHNYTTNGLRNGTFNVSATNKFITYNFSITVSGAPLPPVISQVVLNSSNNTNATMETLTAYIINATDPNGDPILNITHWYRNNKTWEQLIVTFDGNTTNSSIIDYAWGKYVLSYTPPLYYDSAGGIRGGAFFFNRTNASDSLISISNSSIGPLFGSYSRRLTALAWVKTTDSAGEHHVFQRANSKPGGWAAYTYNDDVYMRVWNSSGASITLGKNNDAVPANTWVFLAWRYNGSHLSTFANGIETTNLSVKEHPGLILTNYPITIGGTTGTFGWNGSLDELRIYNESLSNQQIQAFYNTTYQTIVEQETTLGQTWIAEITPSDTSQNGQPKNSTPLTIIGSLPSISDVKCNNASALVNCTTILYGDTISEVQINCTQGTLPILNATAQLFNLQDQQVLFANGTTTQNNSIWTAIASYTVQDSGDMRLTATCTDTELPIIQTINWSIPWGTLQALDNTSPTNTTLVNQNATFTYIAKLRCTQGECGAFNATADPVPAGASITTALFYGNSAGLDDDNDGYEIITGGIDFTTVSQFNWEVNTTNLCTLWTRQRNQTVNVQCYGSTNCCAHYQLIPARTGWNDTYVLYNPQQQPQGYTLTAQTTYYEEDLSIPTITTLTSNTSALPATFVPNIYTITQRLSCPVCSTTVPTSVPATLLINVTSTPQSTENATTTIPITWTVLSLQPTTQNATHITVMWTLNNVSQQIFPINVMTPPYSSHDDIITTIAYKQSALAVSVDGPENPALMTTRHLDTYTNEICSDFSCTQTKHPYPVNYPDQNVYQPISTAISINNCLPGYSYCVDQNLYQVHYKADLSLPEPIRIIKNGYGISYTPTIISYENGANTYIISEIHNTTQAITSNTLTNAQPFGLAIPLTFTYHPSQLKDELTLPDLQILPSTPGLWSQAQTTFTYRTTIAPDQNLILLIDGAATVPAIDTPFTEIKAVNSTGEIVFTIPQAVLRDAQGLRVELPTTIRYNNGVYIHKVRIPYPLLTQLSYPVTIDPTTTIAGTSIKGWGWIKHEVTTDTYGKHPQDTEISVLNYLNGSKLIRDRAWMEFNTSTIPDNAYVSNALLNYTVVQGTFEDIGMNIAFTVFNVTASAFPNNATGYKAIHDIISRSAIYAQGGISNGTDIATLGAQAAFALQNNLTSDHFGIGFKPEPDDNLTTPAIPILIGTPWHDNPATYPSLTITYSLGPNLFSPAIAPPFPQLGKSINCSVIVTDYENDTIKWVNFTINSSIAGSNALATHNGTRANITWTSQSFTPNKIGSWMCLIQSSDNTSNLSQTSLDFLVLEPKTAINTTPGAKPFWTSSLNPQICPHLYAGQNCTNSWSINATGLAGGSWEIFTLYTPINYTAAFNQTITPKRTVTIT